LTFYICTCTLYITWIVVQDKSSMEVNACWLTIFGQARSRDKLKVLTDLSLEQVPCLHTSVQGVLFMDKYKAYRHFLCARSSSNPWFKKRTIRSLRSFLFLYVLSTAKIFSFVNTCMVQSFYFILLNTFR